MLGWELSKLAQKLPVLVWCVPAGRLWMCHKIWVSEITGNERNRIACQLPEVANIAVPRQWMRTRKPRTKRQASTANDAASGIKAGSPEKAKGRQGRLCAAY